MHDLHSGDRFPCTIRGTPDDGTNDTDFTEKTNASS